MYSCLSINLQCQFFSLPPQKHPDVHSSLSSGLNHVEIAMDILPGPQCKLAVLPDFAGIFYQLADPLSS